MTDYSPYKEIPNRDLWLTAGVAVVAVGFAIALLLTHFANPDALWHGVHHDRSGHLGEGLNFALALRAFDPITFILELSRAQVWPPVHGLVMAFVMVLFGPDPRLGIVPSLIGWSTTIVLIWLITSRLFASRLVGIFAGGIAVVFAVASPSFRLLATDVMFEALGSALSALTLYLYLRTQSAPEDLKRWVMLGVTLTILFFEKYNYWALAIVALAIAWFAEHPQLFLARLRQAIVALQLRTAPLRIAKSPLIWAATATGALVVTLYARGPTSVILFGKAVSLYPPENLVTITYALIFTCVALWWKRNRDVIYALLGPAALMLVRCHIIPVAISFLLPKRLSAFIWFVSPNNAPVSTWSDKLNSFAFQWPAFAEGFHVATWSAALVLALAFIGGVRARQMAPGALVIPVFAALCAIAVLGHPQQQWRFQATWMFAVWICAGLGGGILMQWFAGHRTMTVRIAAVVASFFLIAAAHFLQTPSAFAQRVAIRESDGPSDMFFARALTSLVPGADPVGVIASFGRTPFPQWVLRSECRCLRKVDSPWTGATRAETRRLASDWLARTEVTRIVVIDALAAYPQQGDVLTPEILAGGLEAIAAQDRFKRVSTVTVPEFQASVSLWQRN